MFIVRWEGGGPGDKAEWITVLREALSGELTALSAEAALRESELAKAEELIAVAEAGSQVLQVGHLEWFNAASRVIKTHVRAPRFVEVRRLGPFPARATDVDVVRDLMIHDIDILQQVLGEEPWPVVSSQGSTSRLPLKLRTSIPRSVRAAFTA